MSCLRWSALFVIAGFGAVSAPVSYAKPPDLPNGGEVLCREDGEAPALNLELFGLSRVNPPAADAGGSLPVVDAWCPDLMPLLLRRLWQTAAVVTARTNPDPECSESARLARDLFFGACRSIRAGEMEPAKNLLKKAHMTNPTCHFGQLAIQRLLDIEANERAVETTTPLPDDQPVDDETAQAERSFRRVRETTVPLGTVRGQTY